MGAVLAATVAAIGCSGCDETAEPATASGDAEPSPAAEPSTDAYQPVIQLVDALPMCDVDHRGLLLDLGSEAMVGRYGWQLGTPEGIVAAEHGGASWARVYDRSFTLGFFLPEPERVFVSMRAIGRDARAAHLRLDGSYLGLLRFSRQRPDVESTSTTALPADAGLHRLQIRFRGRRQSDADPFAELDWVRIGVPDELKRTYGAPTLFHVLAPAAELGGVPHRALGLRAPGSIRCTVRVPADARLRTAVGLLGQGTATAALRIRADQSEPSVLRWLEVEGGASSRWTDVDVPLGGFESRIVSVELVAAETRGPGQLLFGDPMLVAPPNERPATPRATTVIIVVLDGAERADLPPWRSPTPHMPNLAELVRASAVFDRHRAPSTLVAATVASLLSGLSPRAHGLVDDGARLPASVLTMGAIAREGSVRAAMFTGVPTTFEAFGFGEHWDHFVAYSPSGNRLASAPFEDAIAWLGEAPARGADDKPLLALLHTRGGHPPWELTPKQAKELPPKDYTGYLGPRRSAQILADARARRSRLSETDRERMRALYFAGLTEQDLALGKLIEQLDESGRWDSTLLIVTGDVASGRNTLFADGAPLDEELLTIPLYVHFPGDRYAGERIERPTEVYDIARTALAALGLTVPPEMLGRDLGAIAARADHAEERIRLAVIEDRYAARWGRFVLWGEIDKRPRLCELSLDPACEVDRSALYPIVTQAAFHRLVALDRRPPRPPPREPVVFDAETVATLKVWGVY